MPSLSRAATLAAGLLATAVSATFNPASSRNVAVYWGQGYDQIPLSDVCNDENVDIVNLAFVNQFPKKRGDYPATNFANACGEQFFEYPDGTLSGLRSYCPSIGPGIKDCQAKGKKVLLSIGGGWPTDYYLQSKDIAEYFAEFLWGAFGPQTAKWVADGKPRPFGDASVDGFDLDLEAFMEPAPFSGYLDANYDYFVKHLKNKLFPTGPSTYYISGAPQCVLPDARLAAAISKSSFDFVFIQFYNTPQCSSRAGYNGIVGTATSFTFDQWVAWLKKNSVNKQVRLYLGLPANEAGAPNDVTSYLTPAEANKLVTFYAKKYPEIFGGVMLWEASLAARNKICEKNYNSWIKDILVGKYSTSPCAPKPSSSSTRASSTISSNRSSTISSTPTPVVSSSKTSASPTSSAVTSSAQSSAYPTSSAAPSSAVTSSAQSSVYGTSSAAPSSAAPSSVQSSVYGTSSVAPSSAAPSSVQSSVYGTSSAAPSSAAPSSAQSSVYGTSSVAPSSAAPSSAQSSVYGTSSAAPSSAAPSSVQSSAYGTSSADTSSAASSILPSSPSSVPSGVYSTSSDTSSIVPSATSSVQSYGSASSSAASSLIPTETPSLESSVPATSSCTSTIAPSAPSSVQSSVYATSSAASSAVYSSGQNSTSGNAQPTGSSSSTKVYSSVPHPTGGKPTSGGVSHPSSTPCTTGSVSSTNVYPGAPSSTPAGPSEYPPASPSPTGSAQGSSAFPVASSKGPVVTKSLTKPAPHETEEYYTPQPTGESYVPEQPEGEGYVPETPEGETVHSTDTVVQVVTLTKVPVHYTPNPVPYAPANSTLVYVPSGTASSSGYGSYPTNVPPQFEGAASRFGMGASMFAVFVAGLLLL